MSVHACERCGAALPAALGGTAVRCGYCGAENVAPAGAGFLQMGDVRFRVPLHPVTPDEIRERFAIKGREEAAKLRKARIYAAVFGGLFLLVLGAVLLLMSGAGGTRP
ncbi:MAG TPA: hypothetical protein VIY73_12365 [Polyangiaceae bacterium]